MTWHKVIEYVHSEFSFEISSPSLLLHSKRRSSVKTLTFQMLDGMKNFKTESFVYLSRRAISLHRSNNLQQPRGYKTYQSRFSPLFEVLVLGDHQVAIALNSHSLSLSFSPSTTKSTPSSDVKLGLITSHSTRQPQTPQCHGFKVFLRSPQSCLWVFCPSSFPGLSSSTFATSPSKVVAQPNSNKAPASAKQAALHKKKVMSAGDADRRDSVFREFECPCWVHTPPACVNVVFVCHSGPVNHRQTVFGGFRTGSFWSDLTGAVRRSHSPAKRGMASWNKEKWQRSTSTFLETLMPPCKAIWGLRSSWCCESFGSPHTLKKTKNIIKKKTIK